ncbi:MAG TPA: hypothetical protein VFV38_07430 [Ktedonobacteraceae bacterium]|nr:hypothetical protein [Ktedonobacteraceae bacterium]
MYNFQLDAETIVTRLGQTRTTGTLQAEVPPQTMLQIMKIKETGTVQIVFQKGEITSCALTTKQGRDITRSAKELFQLLAQMGILQWQLLLTTPASQAPAPQAPENVPHYVQPEASASPAPPTFFPWTSVPYRLQEVDINQLQDWTVRKVYQLIDGQRSIEKIIRLSRVAPEITMHIVQQLYAQQIIGVLRG